MQACSNFHRIARVPRLQCIEVIVVGTDFFTIDMGDDIAHIDFKTHEVPCKTNPLGVKGCGEAGAIGSPPAVINAVLDALNSGGHKVAHIDMPASPSRVWDAMQG